MAYRNKTYIAFDADSDIHYYRLMQAWKQNDNTDFNFYDAHEVRRIMAWSSEESKKTALRERMKNSYAFILLVGDKTRFQNTYVRWEIDQAIKQGLPIIVANLDGKRSINEYLCPLILRDKLAVHVAFGPKIIQHALENWTANATTYQRTGRTGPFYYNDEVYQALGISR